MGARHCPRVCDHPAHWGASCCLNSVTHKQRCGFCIIDPWWMQIAQTAPALRNLHCRFKLRQLCCTDGLVCACMCVRAFVFYVKKKKCSTQPYMFKVADHLLLTPEGFLESPTGSKKELQHLSSSCQQHWKGKHIFTHVRMRQILAAPQSYLVMSKCITYKRNTNYKCFQLTASQCKRLKRLGICFVYKDKCQMFWIWSTNNDFAFIIYVFFLCLGNKDSVPALGN